MTVPRTICILPFLMLLVPSMLLAQASGDYRTKASGRWSAAATWEAYHDSAWVSADSAPTGIGTITLANTDSVEIDAAVTITGTLKSTGGWVYNSASRLTFRSGSTYEHGVNGGSLPVATWGAGSTLLITGVTANAPANGNQNFYNVTWNCPGQTSGVNLGWMNNTVGGDVRVKACGNTYPPTASIAFRMTASSAPAPSVNTIEIKGAVIVDSMGSFTATSSSGADTILIKLDSSITSNGVVNLANGSGATCNWQVKGDVRILGGSFTTNSSITAPDTFIFAGTKPQFFTKAGSVGSLSNISFAFMPGTTVDMDTSNVGSSANSYVVISRTAKLITAHPRGLKGNFPVRGVVTIDPDASIVYDGTITQSDSLLSTTIGVLTVNNPAGLALLKPMSPHFGINLTAGPVITGPNSLSISPVAGVTRGTGYVDGALRLYRLSNYPLPFYVGTADGYTPVTLDAKDGNGWVEVRVVQGVHPNTFDSTKTLGRYWTITNNAGITQATLTFAYPQGEVRGNEAKYGAWRYSGSGTNWTALACTVDTANNLVTVPNVTGFSDWTLGESNLVTGVNRPAPETIPASFFVAQNYPNPFNPTTTIRYSLPHRLHVILTVFNTLGQLVATLVNGQIDAGVHEVQFNANDLASGVYFYRLQAEGHVMMRSLVLIR